MPKQSSGQKATVRRVMHEFKHGELETRGRRVRSRKQAVAIALSEAGSSNQQSPSENRRKLARTKSRESHGETAQAQGESGGRAGGTSRAELYEQAKRRGIPGRSGMSKAQLEKALRRH